MEDLTTVVVSGYFDPLHVGHIEYLDLAKSLGDILVVIVNNDKQAALKKGKSFMNEQDRLTIVSFLKPVDHVFLSIDEGKDVCKSLAYLRPHVFANGGDRANREIPEAKVCDELGIALVDGLGTKIRSSSDYTGLK